MVREDWAQWGTAMQQSSATIRSWLDGSRPVWAVGKPEKFQRQGAQCGPGNRRLHQPILSRRSPVVAFGRVADIASRQDAAHLAVVALSPVRGR